MEEKNRVGIVAAGFAVVVGLMISLAGVGLARVESIRGEFEFLVSEHNVKVDMIQRMRAVARDRLLATNRMLLVDDPFERDRLFMLFLAYGNEFVALRRQCEAHAATAAERRHLDRLRELSAAAALHLERVAELSRDNRQGEARRILIDYSIAAQNRLMDYSDRLLADYRTSAEQALVDTTADYRRTTREMLLLAVACVVAAAGVAVAVVRMVATSRDAVRLAVAQRQRVESDLERVRGAVEDVVERRTEELARRARRLATAQRMVGVGYWEWDVGGDAVLWSDETFHMLGFQPGEVEPGLEMFLSRVHPDDREMVEGALKNAVERGETYSINHRVVLNDGRVRVFHFQGELSHGATGGPTRLIGVVRDVTDEKEAESRLWHIAHHDSLSGLPNRSLLYTMLAQAMARAKRAGQELAVALVDLDGFKQVNDTLGHAAGDRVIVHVAGLMKRAVRESDVVARLAGDEFVLLLEGINERHDAERVVEKVLEGLAHTPMHWRGKDIRVAASVGIAYYPGDAEDLDNLLNRADAAMYRAKSQGKAGFEVYRDNEARDANLPLPLGQ